MKNLRLLICALLGVASAILSFSIPAQAAETVALPYYGINPDGGSPFRLSLSPPACDHVFPPQAGYVFTEIGCDAAYYHRVKKCYASNPSSCIETMVFIEGSKSIMNCPAGQSLSINGTQVTCVNPCAESGGNEFTLPVYIGDTSGGADGSAPSSICNGQCRAMLLGVDECYSRAYLATSPKFGQAAMFCEATYITTTQICVKSDDPNNPPPPDAPTDPNDPQTPLPSAPPTAPTPPPGEPTDPGAPDASDGPPDGAPTCAPGTYAVKAGNQWICNSIDAPHPKPDDEGCPPGTQAGTVNGNTTCMPGGSGKPSTNSPGSGTAGATGADGAGGTGGPGGAGAGSPGATADTGGSVGGGAASGQGAGLSTASVDCGVEPVCEGDPLLCGIQRQEWQSACDVQKAIASPLPDDELEKWKAIGTDSVTSAEIDGSLGKVDQFLASFSSRLSFSTGGCPGDFSISVMGAVIPIAISDACPLLQIMKMIIFMGAYLFSIRVLWSSVI